MEQKKTVWFVIGLVVLALMLAGVAQFSGGGSASLSNGRGSGATNSVAPSAPSVGQAVRDADYGVAEESKLGIPSPVPSPTAGETAADVDQKIIKNGYLSLVVDRVGETSSRVTSIAAGKGGFVQSSSVSERGDGTQEGQVVIRVPADSFESTMSEIKDLATQVKSESLTGQDVTEQYTDLEARLRNAKAQEEVYLDILERARTVEEILQVQSYLGSIRSQIEQLEGRIQYIENLTSFSTITVYLSEEPTIRVPTREFRPLSAAREAFQAAVALFQLAIIAVIWIVIVGVAVMLPLMLLAWILWKLARRFMRN